MAPQRPLGLLAGAALALVAACQDDRPRCVPGASAACACADGRSGAQVCAADSTFGPCRCEAPPARSTRPPAGPPRPPPSPSLPSPSAVDAAVAPVAEITPDLAAAVRALAQDNDRTHVSTLARLARAGTLWSGRGDWACVERLHASRRAAVDALRDALAAPAPACERLRAADASLAALAERTLRPDGDAGGYCEEPPLAVPAAVTDARAALAARCGDGGAGR